MMPIVLAMGKFESIHTGHRALINEVVGLAKQRNLASGLLVFEPHPYKALVDPGYKPLLTQQERVYVLDGMGLDFLLEYPFDANVAELTPAQFCKIIFEELHTKLAVVGEGYRFGCRREGTIDDLREYAFKYDAEVHVVTTKGHADAGKTSTSTIRSLLSESRMAEANDMLGYSFFIMGTVADCRGFECRNRTRIINIYPPDDKFLPPSGVYDTQIQLCGKMYKGTTNIGLHVDEITKECAVETQVFDCDLTKDALDGVDVKVLFFNYIHTTAS